MDGFVKLRLTIFVAKSVNNNETLFFDTIIMRISCQEANLIMHASHHWPFSVVLFLLFSLFPLRSLFEKKKEIHIVDDS